MAALLQNGRGLMYPADVMGLSGRGFETVCCCITEQHEDEDEGGIAAVRQGDRFGLCFLKPYFTGGLICRREMRNYG